jgi:signal transduction histidine kinase
MKSVSKSRRKQIPPPEDIYRQSLQDYISHPSEAALRSAYELGRASLRKGTSLVDLAISHQKALFEILRNATDKNLIAQATNAASDFLAEILSPYEMAHRGFQEAVGALRRMNETLEEEIKRIAYAVHDEAGQLLVAVHLGLADLARGASPQQKEEFEHVNQLLKQVETQLRQYSHELRPTILDDLGLIPAVRFLAGAVSTRAALPIQVSANLKSRLSPAVEIAVYRIVQEALNNAVKHARASSISVEILHEPAGLACCIQDDGIGFDPGLLSKSRPRKGLGLTSMNERLNSIGGSFEISSASGRGTRVEFRVPQNLIEVKHGPTHTSRG